MISGLTLNMITYNEAHRIRDTLTRALQLVDEVVVVDQGSTDGTPDIVRSMGLEVYTDEHHGFAEPSRMLALNLTRSPWVLSLDADEHCDDEFALCLWKMDVHAEIRTRVGAVIAGETIAISEPRIKLFRRDSVYYLPQLHTAAIPREGITESMGRYTFPGVAIWDTKTWVEALVGLEQYEALGRTDVSWLYLAREHGLKGEDLDAMTVEERHALGFLPLF